MAIMKTVRLLYWSRSKYHDGNRDTAEQVLSIEVPQEIAVRFAKHIDEQYVPPLNNACGHGVTIIYGSGRKRTVREKYD